MKKIFLFACITLTLCISSCKKDDTENKSNYDVKLTVIKPEKVYKRLFLNPFTVLSRKIKSITSNNDEPAELRQRKVMELFHDKKIIKIAIASSWEKNITDANDAIMLAVKKVNAAGGVAGAQIELVKADDDADVNQGLRTAYKLADDNEIFAVLGHAFSDISTQASLIYNYYGMLMFSPISSSSNLTRQKNSSIFRNVPEDSKYGKCASEFCMENGWNNIAVLYLDVPFGRDMANAFELECGVNSVSVSTRDNFTFTQTESEYKNLFKKWKNNYKIDGIFLIGNMPQIEKIMHFIREAEMTQPVIGSDSFDDPRLEVKLGDTENEKLYAISSFNSKSENPKYLELVRNFEEQYGHKPDQEGVQWYDAFMVLTTAINMTGKPSLKDVTTTLRKNKWSEAAGPYTFDDYGNVVGKSLVVKEMINGKYEIVK